MVILTGIVLNLWIDFDGPMLLINSAMLNKSSMTSTVVIKLINVPVIKFY